MKILVINPFGGSQVVDSQFVPQIGSQVDMFYKPLPTVKTVVNFPSEETLNLANCNEKDVVAIVVCE